LYEKFIEKEAYFNNNTISNNEDNEIVKYIYEIEEL
jgi:hypothetical protein